jgi:tRNA-uridine 2-sulfurtransferase
MVTVGPRAALTVTELQCEDIVWYCKPVDVTRRCSTSISSGFDELSQPRSTSDDALTVQVRAHGEAVPATVAGYPADDDGITIALPHTPLQGVAAGQSAVLYRGTQVVAQGTITAAR